MVKVASSTEGVFLVGPSNDKLRPWCGKCHKFLKSETAAHDCTPVDLRAVRQKGTSKKSRRFRMTKTKQKVIMAMIKDAAYEHNAHKGLRKLEKAKSDKAILKAAKEIKRNLGSGGQGSFSQTADRMYNKIFK